jgi:hypothetical protein
VPSPADDDSSFTNSLIGKSKSTDSFALYFASQDQVGAQNVKELKAENEQLRRQLKKDYELQKLKDLLKTIGFKSRDQARRLDRVNNPDFF